MLVQLLKMPPRPCDTGTNSNVQRCKHRLNDASCTTYGRLRDSDVRLLTSASVHDSMAAISLSVMAAQRVTNCYDLMNATYCSVVLRQYSNE